MKKLEWNIPKQIQTRGVGWGLVSGYGISRGIEERAYKNSRGQLKKEWSYQSEVIKKKSFGISMDLDFWPWNFQDV